MYAVEGASSRPAWRYASPKRSRTSRCRTARRWCRCSGSRLERGLDGDRAVLHERADRVAHDLCALEHLGERIDRVLGLDDLVGGRLQRTTRSAIISCTRFALRPTAVNGICWSISQSMISMPV